jgi:hypothetical protein
MKNVPTICAGLVTLVAEAVGGRRSPPVPFRIFKLVEVTQACDPLSTGKKPKRPVSARPAIHMVSMISNGTRGGG